ncbi:hypothetical protein [Leptospira kmetyi]|uniref:hypothetical protein n=1 Tax=Leptospira kmetyi TaxID=408139 RepID=UPI003EBA2686
MKNNVNAFMDDETENIFLKLGLLGKYNAHELKCKFCKSIINKENLHSIFSESGEIKLVCSALDCIDQFHRQLEKKRYG